MDPSACRGAPGSGRFESWCVTPSGNRLRSCAALVLNLTHMQQRPEYETSHCRRAELGFDCGLSAGGGHGHQVATAPTTASSRVKLDRLLCQRWRRLRDVE